MNTFAERLERLRKDRGFTQEELAKKIGMKRQAVLLMEKNNTLPTGSNLIHLAEALDTSIEYLIGNIDYDSRETREVNALYIKLSDANKHIIIKKCIELLTEEGKI